MTAQLSCEMVAFQRQRSPCDVRRYGRLRGSILRGALCSTPHPFTRTSLCSRMGNRVSFRYAIYNVSIPLGWLYHKITRNSNGKQKKSVSLSGLNDETPVTHLHPSTPRLPTHFPHLAILISSSPFICSSVKLGAISSSTGSSARTIAFRGSSAARAFPSSDAHSVRYRMCSSGAAS